MVVKDKIIGWYLRNIYLPKSEEIGTPGYIGEHMGKQRKFFLREIAMPEGILIEVEKEFKEKQLYSVGKRFGYRYAMISDMTTIKTSDKEKFLRDAGFLVNYIESISYGRNLKHTIDYEKRIFTLTAEDYIICRKTGLGYILSSGGIAGIWSYSAQDATIEGVHTKCRGRGDKACEIVCAPARQLGKMGLKYQKMTDMKGLELGNSYPSYNQKRQTKYAKNSLKTLIDAGIVRHSHGIIDYRNERLFLCEASLMYLLEKGLQSPNDRKYLFDISYNWGKEFAKKSEKKDASKLIQDILPAFGWGDLVVLQSESRYRVLAELFPWTQWYKEIQYSIFRGILSGIISQVEGKKIVLGMVNADITNGYLIVSCSE